MCVCVRLRLRERERVDRFNQRREVHGLANYEIYFKLLLLLFLTLTTIGICCQICTDSLLVFGMGY